MSINIQPTLENEKALLIPLREADFEAVYQVASDPRVWEQHPNRDRWQKFWGKGLNPAVKTLMMDYIFPFVGKIHFHIGATNFRSQISIQRLGAAKIGEETVAYYGEQPKLNFVYEITPATRKR